MKLTVSFFNHYIMISFGKRGTFLCGQAGQNNANRLKILKGLLICKAMEEKKQLKFLHIFQKIGNPIRKSQVDDFGKDDFIWARRNFLQRLLRH